LNFTAGLILLFLNVFLPGLLFLRFYFTGEFSKQFTTRVPIARVAFYALIPGFIIQALGLSIYNCIDDQFTILNALEIFTDLMHSSGDFSEETQHFLNERLHTYIIYTSTTCSSAYLFGVLLHLIVRKYELDIKYKVLRFRNHWYYVFSGDIQHFEKFRMASKNLSKIHNEEDRGIMMSFADILVSNNGKTDKYSGYVVDYELDAKDIQKLDKIYLLEVQKYVYRNPERTEYELKNIPGDLFVIDNSQVININLTYIPSTHKKTQRSDKLKSKKNRNENLKNGALIATTSLLIAQLFFNAFNIPSVNRIINELNIIQKILLLLSILSLLAVIFYDKKEKRENKKEFNDTVVGMLVINVPNAITIVYEIFR